MEKEKRGFSTIIATNSGEDCVEIEGEPGTGMQFDSPDEVLDPGEYYNYAGYARDDWDMLARLTDTHHRVVGRMEQELPPHHQ